MVADLDKLNLTSLTDVAFLTDESVFYNLNSFTILFAKNGIYYIQKNKWGKTVSLIKNLAYMNNALLSIDQSDAFQCFIPKPSINILESILATFKYVQNKTKNEFMINLYYDTQTNKFIIDYIDQIITSGSVKYIYTEKYEQDDRYIKYLEIHSHHSMSANFSSIDDNDEKNKLLCFYGVIGNINENSNIYTMGSKFRIWNGFAFLEIALTNVFNIPENKEVKILNVNRIDEILETSRKRNLEQYFILNSDINIPIMSTTPLNFHNYSVEFTSYLVNFKKICEINNIEIEEELIIGKEDFIFCYNIQEGCYLINNNTNEVTYLNDTIGFTSFINSINMIENGVELFMEEIKLIWEIVSTQ